MLRPDKLWRPCKECETYFKPNSRSNRLCWKCARKKIEFRNRLKGGKDENTKNRNCSRRK